MRYIGSRNTLDFVRSAAFLGLMAAAIFLWQGCAEMGTGVEAVVADEAVAGLAGGGVATAGATALTGATGAAAAAGLSQAAFDTLPAATSIGGSAATGLTFGSAIDTAKTIATVLSPITSIASSAAGISASRNARSLLAGVPQVAPPVTMPSFGSADTLNAMRANIQEQVNRRGRAATILTSPDSGETLGN